MDSFESDDGYVIVQLEPGDLVLESLREAIDDHDIETGAVVSGIGTLSNFNFHYVHTTDISDPDARNTQVEREGAWEVTNVEGVIADLEPADVRPDLRASLDGTDLLQRYFRINATRALMILKRYKGYEKSASEQQVSSEMLLGFAEDLEDFAVIEETYREILEDKLAVDAIERVVAAIDADEVDLSHHRVDSPTPRAFGLATLMASDVVLAEDESAVLQDFHERVLDEIEGEYADGDPEAEAGRN